MGMRYRWALACVALVALSGCVAAQDGADSVCTAEACASHTGILERRASACTQHAEAQKGDLAALQNDIDQLVGQADKLKSDCDMKVATVQFECKGQVEAAKKASEATIATLTADLASALAQASTASSAAQDMAAAAVARNAQLEAEIAGLRAQLTSSSAVNADLGSIARASLKLYLSAQDCVVAEAKLLFAELKEGNTTRLATLTESAVQSASSAVSAAATAVVDATTHLHTQLTEKAPGVASSLNAACAWVSAFYQKHVVEAAWTAEVVKQFAMVNDELKALLARKIPEYPALAVLNDPVYIQLIAYTIIGAPLCLLSLPVLLWLATLLAPKGPSKDVAAKKAAKKVIKKNH
ncbi:hypothetical protein FOA52_014099 [Chlamydomonas sp. UWO 241]|nr:hypothetical protein FOA52_014099 [Chlamydomonas sp. UWO 241]